MSSRSTVCFDYHILKEVEHRPWPLPDRPWVMTQTWHDLLFAHWPIDKTQLRAMLPTGLDLDLHQEQAWVGIVPFRMTNVAPRALPVVPWMSAFPELNVRTYVRVHDRPGVYFFSLDAASAVVVGLARLLFNLPYYTASMKVTADGPAIRYRSDRKGTASHRPRFVASYRPTGGTFQAQPHSLEYFLTERYCLYTVDKRGQSQRLDIHHRPWALQTATASFESNTMAEANGLALPATPPLLHFAKRQDAVAWLPAAT